MNSDPKPKNRRRWTWITLALVGGSVIWAGCATSRLGYESPEYRTTVKDGDFEIRAYQELRMVSTPMGALSEGSEMNRGFGRLFKYITGENEGAQKVAMTTPVLMDTGAGESGSMNFVLPKAVAEQGAPTPSREGVTLKTYPGGTMAALRFHGYRDQEAVKNAEAKLREWVAAQEMQAEGTAMFAYYDPPWTPEFLRRNEVLIRMKGE